jgi:hypothetical protein
MFIKNDPANGINLTVDGIQVTFIKSTNVQVYPCGRRRGNADLTGNSESYIPFDPEARLNTEANNRKHSGLNGYTQTYIKDWEGDLLTMSLGGYLFNITFPDGSVPDGYLSQDGVGKKIAENVLNSAATKIYANILIQDVHLYSGFTEYYTGVLRNQTATDQPTTSLDLLVTGSDYYFSGLSFSTSPLTEEDKAWSSISRLVTLNDGASTTVKQTVISLCILNKTQEDDETEATWKLYQPALLPKIEHGDTEDSIAVTGNALMKSTLDVEGIHTAHNQIIATETLEGDVPNIVATRTETTVAEIETANIATAKTVDAKQKIAIANKNGENPPKATIEDGYYAVPVIFVRHTDTGEYQLQIARTNTAKQSN